ncbi:MAG TPA: hypothetical protein DDZ24_03960, partial [Planctomycetaceae bacterium]|nr:hypothetical protein [Planctomycetaceae bacterium]
FLPLFFFTAAFLAFFFAFFLAVFLAAFFFFFAFFFFEGVGAFRSGRFNSTSSRNSLASSMSASVETGSTSSIIKTASSPRCWASLSALYSSRSRSSWSSSSLVRNSKPTRAFLSHPSM